MDPVPRVVVDRGARAMVPGEMERGKMTTPGDARPLSDSDTEDHDMPREPWADETREEKYAGEWEDMPLAGKLEWAEEQDMVDEQVRDFYDYAHGRGYILVALGEWLDHRFQSAYIAEQTANEVDPDGDYERSVDA